jgi:uncharacterized membrane protein YfcA
MLLGLLLQIGHYIMADFINGMFELFAGLFLTLNVIKLYKDKEVKGVSVISVAFFASWGYWNCYFYPSLNQWWSFVGGIGVVIMNSIWVGQMIYYGRKK